MSADNSTLVLPIILRWFQIKTLSCFRSLSMGRTAHMPNFQEITALIERRAYHLLPPLPQQYLAPATATRPASASAEAPISVGRPPAALSSAPPDNRRDPGPRINNPGLVPEWGAAFNNSNTTIWALREFAPSTHDRDTQATVPICLSYHLRGSCYENCQRASMHRALSAAERRSMSAFVAQRLGTTSEGGGGQPAVQPQAPSRQLVAPPPRRAADGLAKCCNRVALAGHPQLQTYLSPQSTHTGRCPGPWS